MSINPVVLRRPLPAMFRVSRRFEEGKFNGQIFECPGSTFVLSCAEGRVIKTGQSKSGHWYIWLWCELPGVTCRVLYDGLQEPLVKEGKHVSVDQILGSTHTTDGRKLSKLYVEVRGYPGDVAVEPDWFDDYVDNRILNLFPE